MRFAIFADVRQLEPLGIVEIDLNGRALPGPSQDILDLDVNLGTVKHALPRINPVAHPAALQGRLQRRRGLRPAFGGSHRDRKSTRLNSSHGYISYAVFCLKKKKNTRTTANNVTTSTT